MDETHLSASDFTAPWHMVSSEERELIEAELKRELGEQHILYRSPVIAIARREDNDDVLFESIGHEHKIVIVHLTWSGGKEANPVFPSARWYSSFEEWKTEMRGEKDDN